MSNQLSKEQLEAERAKLTLENDLRENNVKSAAEHVLSQLNFLACRLILHALDWIKLKNDDQFESLIAQIINADHERGIQLISTAFFVMRANSKEETSAAYNKSLRDCVDAIREIPEH